jgi:hypothetical protein
MTGGAKFTYSRDKGRSRPSASRGTISPHYCLHRDKALKKKKFFDEDEGVSPPLFTPASTSGMRQKKTLGQALYRKSHDTSPSPSIINPVRIKRG